MHRLTGSPISIGGKWRLSWDFFLQYWSYLLNLHWGQSLGWDPGAHMATQPAREWCKENQDFHPKNNINEVALDSTPDKPPQILHLPQTRNEYAIFVNCPDLGWSFKVCGYLIMRLWALLLNHKEIFLPQHESLDLSEVLASPRTLAHSYNTTTAIKLWACTARSWAFIQPVPPLVFLHTNTSILGRWNANTQDTIPC